MTKAPFSVEWLSQSSQALKSPTEGSPHRASSAGRRPGSDSDSSSSSSAGLSEWSQDQPAGPRDGRGGRSRDSVATSPTAGTATTGTARGSRAGGGGAGTPPGRGRQRCAVLGGGGGGRFPTRWPGLADPLAPVAVPRSRWQAVGSGAARGGGGRRGAPRRAAAAHGVQRGADQHPGELLPAAAVPGRGRAPAAGGQDAPVRGAGERWGRATALPNYRIDSPGRPRNLVFSLSSRSRPGFRTGG